MFTNHLHGINKSVYVVVARVWRRGDRPPSRKKMEYLFLANKERQGILVSTSENIDWESPPSILVTRNPNWSQKWGTETGCVKEMY